MSVSRREKYYENSTTGTTTDDYVYVLEWDCRAEDKKLIILKNSGGTNSLDYVVYSRAKFGGSVDYQDYTGTLTAGSMVKLSYTGYVGELRIKVKSTVGSSSTTFAIEYGSYI